LNKFNKLEEIFHQLDGDHDGVISASEINIKNVPIKVLEVISPLLIEMEDANLELTIEEFIIAADKFIKVF
jgi:Ca2+-binding EF-hand superfamily protein